MSNRENNGRKAKEQAARLFTLITGEDDPVIDFRLIPERADLKAKGAPELKLRGRLSELWDKLTNLNRQGYAIFFVANATDGNGTKRVNFTATRCQTLDLDGAPTPDTWPVRPHFITETSPNKFQCTWVTVPSDDFDAYTEIQKRLAMQFGGDPSVNDVPRVFRTPGFLHQKGEPFRSRMVESADPDEVQFNRLSRGDFEWLPDLPVKESTSGDSDDATITCEQAEAWFDVIPVDWFGTDEGEPNRQYDAWVKVGMAMHKATAGAAKAEWLAWNASDSRYDNEETQAAAASKWDGFDDERDGGVTFATVVYYAKQAGVSDATIRKLTHTTAAESFDDLEFLPDDEWPPDFEGTNEPEWPRPVCYRNDRNSRQNAVRFLRHRPGRLISSDRIIYSLTESSGIWTAHGDDDMSAEIAKTDERRALSHTQIDGVRDALHMDTHSHALPFKWIDPPNDAPHANDTIIFRNGLLNVTTGKLMPHTGAFFATATPEYNYDPAATCPRFMQFLSEVLDESYHDTLQEFFGYALTPDTRHQKMLALIGVSRGGKSTVLRLLQKLIGMNHCAFSTMHDLGGTFGLEGTEDKRLVIIPDAKDMRGGHGLALERILQIVGCDAVSINRKHNTHLRRALSAKIVMAANKIVKMLDDASALSARTLLLKFETSFLGREDTNLDAKLAAELPGVANWSLEGLHRLRTNGAFTVGAKGKAAVHQMALGQSPSLRFASDRLKVTGDDDDFMRLAPLFDSYREWAADVEKLPQSEIRGRNDFLNDFTAALAARGVRYVPAAKYRDEGRWKSRRGLVGITWK